MLAHQRFACASALALAENTNLVVLSTKGSTRQIEDLLGNILGFNPELITELAEDGFLCLPYGNLLDAEATLADVAASYAHRDPTSLQTTAEIIDTTGTLLTRKVFDPTAPTAPASQSRLAA